MCSCKVCLIGESNRPFQVCSAAGTPGHARAAALSCWDGMLKHAAKLIVYPFPAVSLHVRTLQVSRRSVEVGAGTIPEQWTMYAVDAA